jgi:hypothetical protein
MNGALFWDSEEFRESWDVTTQATTSNNDRHSSKEFTSLSLIFLTRFGARHSSGLQFPFVILDRRLEVKTRFTVTQGSRLYIMQWVESRVLEFFGFIVHVVSIVLSLVASTSHFIPPCLRS